MTLEDKTKVVENTFKDIKVSQAMASPGTSIRIRDTHHPIRYYPVAIIDCECGTRHKHRLFYTWKRFSTKIDLKCYNEECGRMVELHYSRDEAVQKGFLHKK